MGGESAEGDAWVEAEVMTDPRHRALLDVVKKLPSDFAPWGEQSREEEWAPDCSCGCRWYVRLEPGLQLDWGACRNPASPRCGLLTFEHQGCRHFEADEGHAREMKDGAAAAEESEPEVLLLRNLRERKAELKAQLKACSDHWGYEDPVYRFYHQSFKVYGMQERTRSLDGSWPSSVRWACRSTRGSPRSSSGTGRSFEPEDNRRWVEVTRPIVEAFFHARFFVEMAVRYARLDKPPSLLPSGYAALLCLYGLR